MLRPHVSGRALAALAGLTLSLAPGLAAQNGSVIRGRILDPAGHGIAGALVVRTSPTADTSRADSAGHYALDHLAPGRYVFQFRKAGYDPMEMELTLVNDTALDVDVPLQPFSGETGLAKLNQVGFTARRDATQGRRGRGTFLGPEDITRLNVALVTELFRGVDGVELDLGPERQRALLGDGHRCLLRIWVDGQLDNSPYTLDRDFQVENVLAIEVYPRPSMVPQAYQRAPQYGFLQTRSGDCGAILIWMK